jgi:hypothetical protein
MMQAHHVAAGGLDACGVIRHLHTNSAWASVTVRRRPWQYGEMYANNHLSNGLVASWIPHLG